MKRQYRYKTAADKKDFFTRDWFGELNEVLGKLHGAIAQEFHNKNVFKKMFGGGDPKDMQDYFDAYLMPEDNCAKSMNIIAQYENWYMNAWNFLEKDSYDKIMESMNKCNTIRENLNDFATSKKANFVTTEIGNMETYAQQLAPVAGLSGASATTGFKSDNNKKINDFLLSIKKLGGSKVWDELVNWRDIIVDFNKALTTSNHYWEKAKDSSSPICKRAQEVYDELDEQLRHKKEDEQHKREDENQKREDEKNKRDEEKRNKDIDIRMNTWTTTKCQNKLTEYVDTANDLVTEMRTAFKDHHTSVNDGFKNHAESSYQRYYNQRPTWDSDVDSYFNEFTNAINKLAPSALSTSVTAKDMDSIIRTIRTTYAEIEKSFNKTSGTAGAQLFLKLYEDKKVGGPIRAFNEDDGMEALKKLLEQLFKKMLKEFNDAILK